MAETTVAATAGAAPSEDAVREILARLDEASALFRCAATCRRWRALAAEPAVLRRLWPEPDRSFIGVFTNQWHRGEGVSFVPGPGSVLGSGRRLLSSFIPGDAPGVSDSVQPVAAHQGILLVRLFPRVPGSMQLAVCDILAGTWDVLPALRLIVARYFIGYAIAAAIGGADRSSSSSSPRNYRVLILRTVHEVASEYILHAFSSGQPSWSTHTRFPGHVERSLEEATIGHEDGAICHGGVAHWLFRKSSEFHILHINSETRHVSAVVLRIPGNNHKQFRLTTTTNEKLLSLCTYDEDRRFEVWEQEDRSEDGDVYWLRAKVWKPRLPLEGARLMCLTARSSRLLMMDRHERVHVLDLKSGEMEEMEDEFYDPGLIAVPMEIDWPNFLTSRLRRLM